MHKNANIINQKDCFFNLIKWQCSPSSLITGVVVRDLLKVEPEINPEVLEAINSFSNVS